MSGTRGRDQIFIYYVTKPLSLTSGLGKRIPARQRVWETGEITIIFFSFYQTCHREGLNYGAVVAAV